MDIDNDLPSTVQAKFKSDTGEETGSPLDLPLNVTKDQLQLICNALLQEEDKPFLFFVKDVEITSTLKESLDLKCLNSEEVVEIIYQQQAVFRVRPVTRCTSSIPGHAEAVISTSFSPSGKQLASGSGDTTVRFWDLHTQTPLHVCKVPDVSEAFQLSMVTGGLKKDTTENRSAVCEYVIDKPNHSIKFDKPAILAKEKRYFPRMLREAIEIKKHPNFNREDGLSLPPAWDPVIHLIMEQARHRTAKP